MAITNTKTLLRVNIMGCQKVMDWKMVLTGSYVTGGFAVTPASLGLDVIDFVQIMPLLPGTDDTIFMVVPDLVNNSWYLLGTGSGDDAPFGEAAAGTVTFSFVARVFGVA